MHKYTATVLLLIITTLPCYSQWTIQESNTEADLKSVFFLDIHYGWAAGNHGVITVTKDGGNTWFPQSTPVAKTIHTIHFITRNFGYATTQDRELLMTKDGGTTWSSYDFGENKYIYSTFFLDSQIGWAGGLDYSDNKNIPVLYKSINGGETWNRLYEIDYGGFDPPNFFTHILFNDELNGIIIDTNFNHSITRTHGTSDGGITWEETGTIRGPIFKLARAAQDTLWASGLRAMSVTNDNGNSWDIQINGWGIRDIEPVSGKKGWFTQLLFNDTKDAIIAHTEDACKTYDTILTLTGGHYLQDLASVNGRHLWAVGDSGRIMYFNDVTNISDPTPRIPQYFELHQNYPNPFNPETVIRFSLNKNMHINLVVYDITGKEIHTLADHTLPPGLHIVRWDGTNMSGIKVAGGVYIYRMEAAGQVFSKKMILLK